MKHIVKPALILTLVVFFSALLLSYARKITDPYILRDEIEKQNEAVRIVLHGYTIGEEAIADGIKENLIKLKKARLMTKHDAENVE